MNCWICGKKGNSREHLIKASDLRSVFGDITQQNPIYQHFEDKKGIRIGSAKAGRVKSDALLCKECNTKRTAPHDNSWTKLSEHLRRHPLKVRGNLNIRLSKVYEKEIQLNVLNVHLFFVKNFGCRIIEEDIPIDIEPFKVAIMTETPNPHVFMFFKKALGGKTKSAGITPVYSQNDGNKSVAAAYYYTVGDLVVEILYSHEAFKTDFLKESFHPNRLNKVIKFTDFEEDDLENEI